MAKTNEEINIELIRMARELVLNEYTDLRAKTHNKWLVESDFLWKTQRLRLAYPDIPPHPSEDDIIKRAGVLMNFVRNNRIESEPERKPLKEPVPQKVEEPVTEEVVEEAEIEEAVIEEIKEESKQQKEFNWGEDNVKVSYPELKKEKDIPDTVSKTQELTSFIKIPENSEFTEKDKELLQLSSMRLMKDIEEVGNSNSSKIIPSIMKKLDELKKSRNKY